MASAETQCRACKQPLLDENTMVADGCPCNSPRGVNHGLVPARVCTCSVCDPVETGSARPRTKATQGAAVAGPALPVDVRPMAVIVNDAAGTRMRCTVSGVTLDDDSWDLEDQATKAEPAALAMDEACPEHAHYWFHGHRGQHGFAPSPPASEPPRSYSPTCAGTCWPPCAHHGVQVALFMREDRNRLLVQLADATVAKAALEARVSALEAGHRVSLQEMGKLEEERDETEELRAAAVAESDGLRISLTDARAQIEVAWEDHEVSAGNARREIVHLVAERDALAAQLKTAREALVDAAKALRAGATCAEDDGRPFTAIALSDAAARAALAASGPTKEGTP